MRMNLGLTSYHHILLKRYYSPNLYLSIIYALKEIGKITIKYWSQSQ